MEIAHYTVAVEGGRSRGSRRTMIRRIMKAPMPIIPWFLALSLVSMCFSTDALTYESGCETMPSTIHVVKDEYDDSGRLLKRCEEDLAVNKCEGACVSKVQPSVNTPSGFLKDCKCCRETHLRSRKVTLTHCYDADGNRMTDEKGNHVFTLREPADCKCFKCGDSTR